MLKHFNETPRGWEPDPALLTPIRYRVGNVLDAEARRERFDLVLCRNVLLYFDQATKARAFDRLGSSLREDGWLKLGACDTETGKTGVFAPATGVQRLFRRSGRGQFAASAGASAAR